MSILQRPGWVNNPIFNEGRMSRHSGLLDLSIVQKQLEDKKIGIPYRDARRFLFSFLQDQGVTNLPLPQSAKEINAIIGALVTAGKITSDVSNNWKAYIADTSNLQKFIGSTRSMRNRLVSDVSENIPKSEEEIRNEIMKRREEKKLVRKLSAIDSEVGLTGGQQSATMKINLIGKIEGLRTHLIDFILSNLTDSDIEADQIAEDSIEFVTDKINSAPNTREGIESILDKLSEFGNSADAYIASKLVNMLPVGSNTDNEDNEEDNMQGVQESIKLSPVAQNKLLKEKYRQNLQHNFKIEQKYFGY